jgi:dsRNA-specific ribonuclease
MADDWRVSSNELTENIMDTTQPSAEPVSAAPSQRKKVKDRVMQLSEIRRGLIHQLVAQYGTSDNPVYVMQVCVDGVVFQGIGPSKKRAKSMAAEQALVYIGELDPNEVETPVAEVLHCDDYASDMFYGMLFYNFETPYVSAKDGQLTLPKFEPDSEGYYFEENESLEPQDPFGAHVGRNAVAILSELHPECTFRVVFESRSTNPSRFVQTVKVNFQIFRGEGPSKKLAKGRAAAEALMALYGLNFHVAEDGMPIYEGSEEVWEKHKEKVLKQSVLNLAPVTTSTKNPIEQLNELYPDSVYEFPEESSGSFFMCKVTVAGDTYEAVGMSKKDAKANAASNAIEGLQANGLFEKRTKEMETKRQEREAKQRIVESANPSKPRLMIDSTGLPLGAKNAVSRLNELLPGLEYKVIGQAPLRNTCMTAFAVALTIKGRNFIGVGKNKKLAKVDCAEKAMKALGYWSEDDEWIKMQSVGTTGAEDFRGYSGAGGFSGGWKQAFGRGGGPAFQQEPVWKGGYGRGVMLQAGRGRGKPKMGSGVPGLFDDLGLESQYGGDIYAGGSSVSMGTSGVPPHTGGRLGRGGVSGFMGGHFDSSGWESGYSSDLKGLAADDGTGFSGMQDEYGWETGEGLDSMISDLSSILASIMEANPGIGMNDVWRMLQENKAYQSWQGGDAASFQMLTNKVSSTGPKMAASAKPRNYSSLLSGGSDTGVGPYWGRSTGGARRSRGQPRFGASSSRLGASATEYGQYSMKSEPDWTEWSMPLPSVRGFTSGGGRRGFGRSGKFR